MEAREIVEKWLKENGYDGLYREECCACRIGDLMPCSEYYADCIAGYLCKCDPETCYADGDCDWHIGPEKEEIKNKND